MHFSKSLIEHLILGDSNCSLKIYWQAEILYDLVEQAAGLEGNGKEIVLDLFCGTGTIGLTLAKRLFESC